MYQYKAIIFDCYGVIATPPLFTWYNAYSKRTNKIDSKLEQVFKKFDLDILSENDIAEYFASYESRDKNEIQNEIDECFNLDKSLILIIKRLKDLGYKIGLLSNANASFFYRKIFPEHPELKKLFNSIIISSDVKLIKPDPEIYAMSLKDLKIEASEAIFVDDSMSNTEGAEKVGIKAVLYTNSGDFIDQLKALGISI